MAEEHPNHVLMRASLQQAPEEDKELRAWACPQDAGDGQKAVEKPRAIGNLASPNAVFGTDCGHSNTRYRLRNIEAGKQDFLYDKGQLLRAAVSCAAELHVSRSFRRSLIGECPSEVLIVPNTQLTGWWQGRRRGLFSSLTSAAEFNGSTFDGTSAAHKTWGARPGASPKRLV